MKERHLGISDSVTAALGNVNLYSLLGKNATNAVVAMTKTRHMPEILRPLITRMALYCTTTAKFARTITHCKSVV